MRNFLQKSSALASLLLVCTALLYGPFLSNPPLFDDIPFFTPDDLGHRAVEDYRFKLLELRSLPYATMAWTYQWLGVDMVNFRIGNLLLHGAVALALFAFLLQLFSLAPQHTDKMGLSPRAAAFFAALLFALHPVATYAAGYLVQRSIVMATLFGLLALLAYLYGSLHQKPVWLWATVPLYYLSAFSKEHAIMLPGVVLALTVLVHADWLVQLRRRWPLFAALGLIAFVVLLSRRGFIGSVYEPAGAGMLAEYSGTLAYSSSVLTQSWLFFKYLFLWALPNPNWMSVDMREPFAPAGVSIYLLALVGFLAWGVAGVWLLLRRGQLGLVGLAMLFPWILFFTELATVRIQEVFVLYRSYLWAVGGFCLLPVLVRRLDKRTAAFIFSAVAVAMVPVSMNRLVVFSQEFLLWNDAEKLVAGRSDLPGESRIYMNLGTSLLHMGSVDASIVHLRRAVFLNRENEDAYSNLGVAASRKDNWAEAAGWFQKAIDVAYAKGRDFEVAQGNLGTSYMRMGEWKKAREAYDISIGIILGHGRQPPVSYLHGRAIALENLGDMPAALADYRESCRIGKKGCEKLAP